MTATVWMFIAVATIALLVMGGEPLFFIRILTKKNAGRPLARDAWDFVQANPNFRHLMMVEVALWGAEDLAKGATVTAPEIRAWTRNVRALIRGRA